jgi:enamine deaminase RidA (YjgF/YER057c/UK114 family)
MRKRISSGSEFEQSIGYSRAVVDDDYVFISGTTGYDYSNMHISDNIVEQTEQCMRNIEAVLTQAGCSWQDIVQVRYLLPERDDFPHCWPVLKKYLGDAAPAATMMVVGLYDPAMKIEIEVTARLPD